MLSSNIKNAVLEGKFRVTLDTRLLQHGDYFAAIKGEKFDGHDFIAKALELGAAGVLEEEEIYQLCSLKLNKIKPKIVAVTGSSGKSSTVAFVSSILSKKFKVAVGNLNTKLGLSTNVLNDMPLACDVFVAEMGMDQYGEIARTARMFPPDIAVITTINEMHLGNLGSMENIVKTKFGIVDELKVGGAVLLNHANAHCLEEAKKYPDTRILWFGPDTAADFNFSNISLDHTNILGEHNKMNLLAAIGVAKTLGMSKDEIIDALPGVTLPKGRLNKLEGHAGSTIIDDTYNAGPESMHQALKVLHSFPGQRKIAILGDMLELGEREESAHKAVAKQLSDAGVDVLICSGMLAKIIFENADVHNKYWIENSTKFDEFQKSVDLNLGKNDVVLVKGSQGARMEKIVRLLLKDPNDACRLLVRQDKRWLN